MKYTYLLMAIILTLGVSSGAFAACLSPAGDEGDQFYNVSENKMQYCQGTAWIDMSGGTPGPVIPGDDMGNHTAEQNLNMNNHNVINLGTPTSAQDVATKAYVDGKTWNNETDPKIGAVTNNNWCMSNGTTVECDQASIGTGGLIFFAIHELGSDARENNTGNSTWAARELNTLKYTNIAGASLASNRITLPAGTYKASIRIPYSLSGDLQTRLYDVTNGTALLYGTSLWSGGSTSSGNVSLVSTIEGAFTLSGTTELELQSYKTSNHPNGGDYSFSGDTHTTGQSIYSSAYFIQVAADSGCLLSGQYIQDGESHVFYDTETDSNCASHTQTRNCTSGTLDGNATYQYTSCSALRWVNSTNTDATTACATAGLSPATDKGYGVCAAGESRPTEGPGWDSISYVYGTFAGTSKGGNYTGLYCYRSGQTQDNDGTDRIVAHLCE